MEGTETAFPVIGSHKFYEEQGLTKRELFAVMAMQGVIASEVGSYFDCPEIIATKAVAFADRLIE